MVAWIALSQKLRIIAGRGHKATVRKQHWAIKPCVLAIRVNHGSLRRHSSLVRVRISVVFKSLHFLWLMSRLVFQILWYLPLVTFSLTGSFRCQWLSNCWLGCSRRRNSSGNSKYLLENTFIHRRSVLIFSWENIPIVLISSLLMARFRELLKSRSAFVYCEAFAFPMSRTFDLALSNLRWVSFAMILHLHGMKLGHSSFHFLNWFDKCACIFLILH